MTTNNCAIAHYSVCCYTNQVQNNITIMEEKYYKIITQVTSDKLQRKVCFSFPIPTINILEDLMIRSFETVKILDIKAFFKIISGHEFQHRILDMSGIFLAYGNPRPNLLTDCLFRKSILHHLHIFSPMNYKQKPFTFFATSQANSIFEFLFVQDKDGLPIGELITTIMGCINCGISLSGCKI